MINVGQLAPDFTLKNQQQADVTLSSFRGRKTVVLCFYPFDWSPVCTPENQCFTRDVTQFAQCGAEVFGISCDSVWCHKAFADAHGITHPLLADWQREVCKAYGVYHPDIHAAQRATVIVGTDGKVAWCKQHELKSARDDNEIVAALKKVAA